VLHESPSALSTRRADVSAWLDAAVWRALAKRPDDRFPSAAAFAAALEGRAFAEPPRRRSVSVRAAMYFAGAMLAIGLAGGWAFAKWSLTESSLRPSTWADVARLFSRPPVGDHIVQSPAASEGLSLTVFDRTGRPQRTIAATRPWTPRFAPDGHRVAYGAFGDGRNTSDLWVTELKTGTTRRLTDDDADNNDPQWSADGTLLAYSARASSGKDLMVRPLGGGEGRVLAMREGTQFPSDWLHDGSALLVTEDGTNGRDIIVQPADGSAPRPYAASSADETAARVSPDGRWVAYTSDATGRAEVYLDSYARPGRPVQLSPGGGMHPVWRGDGRELYYWNEGALVAVRIGESLNGAPPLVGEQTVLFRASYEGGVNTMYDASPDGQRFVIVQPR
jgi:hypothetical protein